MFLFASLVFLPLWRSPVTETAALLQHNTSVRQVRCGTILHVRAAAVICHSLSGLKCLLLCTHQGLLRECGDPVACKRVQRRLDTVVCRCLCARVRLKLCVILRAGRSVSRCSSSPSRASLQTLPRARKQETASSEGKCVHGSVTLDDARLSLYLPVWNRWSSPAVS